MSYCPIMNLDVDPAPDPAGAARAPRTLVCFHAHPDDESLLTGGTIAKAAAAGHRVVVVVATHGEAGLTDRTSRAGLGGRRR
ncbi:MAG: hypothetical protein V7637_5410, partial [Mycobacteriales bacterium]